MYIFKAGNSLLEYSSNDNSVVYRGVGSGAFTAHVNVNGNDHSSDGGLAFGGDERCH